MTFNQFSSSLESANFVLTSDPVHQAWNAIEKQKQINPNVEPSLFNEIQQENPTIIAFGNPPSSLQGHETLVSSSNLKEDNFAHFEFLRNKSNPNFSLNQAAIKLFKSQYHELLQLKEKLVENSKSKTPSLVIITGQSVGGSVATLFTLWLLEALNLSKTKRPLCVTFGSPLVGDEHLRQCVLQFSTSKSCFLHIVSNQDPTPQLFISGNPGAYKPFGTFLLCSASGCACFEDPSIILEQLVKTNSQNQECHYGQILADLKYKALCNVFKSTVAERHSLQASIITQLQAIGFLSQQQPSAEINSRIGNMKKHETELLIQKKKNSDSVKKLNEMKVYMAFLECYKTDCKQHKIGYYDMYRKKGNQTDVKVNEYKKKLMNYWEDTVTEIENKPQLEGAHFVVRWLYAGTNYRRMVEPLHIADYYKDGGKNYLTDAGKRPKHFALLEEWLQKKQEQEDKKKEQEKKSGPSKSKRENVGSSLNEDSCFWAHVEEARILCNLLKNGAITSEEKEGAIKELRKFEADVYVAIKKYALSPEIFLEKSSFMQWWKEYNGVVEQPYSSLLLDFMKSCEYEEYKLKAFSEDKLDFTEKKSDPSEAGIISLQLATGVPSTQLQRHSTESNNVIEMMKEYERNSALLENKISDSIRGLNEMKQHLLHLDWYKNEGKRKKTGYYDTFKNQWDPTDKKNEEYKKKLWNYWQDSITEVENKPQTERDRIPIDWFMAAINVKRMIEPLYIAECYQENGAKNYLTGGRPEHFITLEKWWEEVGRPEAIPSQSETEKVSSGLNEDSLFWAYVEEALIWCNQLKDEESSSEETVSMRKKLKQFEDYVLEAYKNRELSPEIFLEQSSFMKWWNKYEVIMGKNYSSSLAKFMKDGTYLQYKEGQRHPMNNVYMFQQLDGNRSI